jgi:hypothetical protein
MDAKDESLSPKRKPGAKAGLAVCEKGMHYQDCDPYQSSICFFA